MARRAPVARLLGRNTPRPDSRRGPGSTARLDGTVRLGRRTKELVKDLEPGQIAVIDHADLDRVAAEDLVDSGVLAVLNNASSSTGRYPNLGPLLIARAGVPIIDFLADDLFELLSDGDAVGLEGASLSRNGERLAVGIRLSREEMELRLVHQRERIDEALAAFATNTIEHVREESELLSGAIEFPPVRTEFRDRQTLIIVRGPDYREDLAALRAYIRDMRPLIVAVDGAADAVIEAGMKADMIIGDMDSASDAALGAGAELVVHAYRDGHAPGLARLQGLGLESVTIPAAGTSEDVAMLLAHERGASLIVAVGAHFNLTEFLDKNRAGMSSTFLTRLRVGETLVDAKGVSRLYMPVLGRGSIAMFAAVFIALAVIVVIASPGLDNVFELLWLKIHDALGF